jgi:Kef-type K+ transport system membrane component KefB
MIMISLLDMILVCLGLAYLLSGLLKKLGLPRVTGQIITGLVLGIGVIKPYLFGQENLQALSFLANLGIVLLFYYAGLETNFRAFTKNIKKSVLISVFNTSIPFVFGFLLMRFVFNFDILASVIIGISLSVSAHAVSIDFVEELKLFKTKLGNLIITAGAVDDVIELLMVAALLSFLHAAISHVTIIRLVFYIILFLFIIIVARLWIVPYTLKFFDLEKSSTARFTGSLIIVLLLAAISEFLAIGALIGALIAGIIVRQTIFKEKSIPNWEERDISKSLHIIAFGFLIPLFFIWVGINTDMSLIAQNYLLLIVLIAIAFAGTIGGTLIAILLSKGTLKEGLTLGWGLNPKGDVELVIITLALTAGIISYGVFTSIVFMSLSTTIVSPIMLRHYLKRKKG